MRSLLFRHHLEKGEPLICVAHRHWLIGARVLGIPFLTLAAAAAVAWVLPFRLVLWGVAAWSIVNTVWILHRFLNVYLDAWLLTDRAVIAVSWHGWFHRSSTRILLSDIHGVSFEVQGILGTVFRYGTIAMEKISTGTAVSLTHVANPRGVTSAILTQQEAYLHTKNLKDSAMVQKVLAEVVANQLQLGQFK